MGKRAYNFNAGPAALPLEVLQKAQEELVDYQQIGMSVMEISHRSAEYTKLNEETQQLVLDLLGAPSGYKVLFMQGGASTQFAMIPMNFLSKDKIAHYVMTGSWANKAIKEAQMLGEVRITANDKETGYTTIPDINSADLDDHAAYLHITSNETIGGLQFKQFPSTGNVPLIADMSSDIMSRPIDVSNFAMIYAGAQKNLGPSGVTLIILREDMLQDASEQLPTMLQYDTYVKNDSLYNTPPVYSVYMMNLVLKWIQEKGGLASIEKMNREKTDLIYDVIDQSGGFYRGVVEPAYRSQMNISFRIKEEGLEKMFLQASDREGFVGLKGHRSVGGLRASTYNAVPYESCKALAEFMIDFYKKHG